MYTWLVRIVKGSRIDIRPMGERSGLFTRDLITGYLVETWSTPRKGTDQVGGFENSACR
jgi:hypothetical protein